MKKITTTLTLSLCLFLLNLLPTQATASSNNPYQSLSEIENRDTQTEKAPSPYESLSELPKDDDE
jgi:hypothetical protein